MYVIDLYLNRTKSAIYGQKILSMKYYMSNFMVNISKNY